MNGLINRLKEYLACNRAERRGMFILLIILNILLIFDFSLPWLTGRWMDEMDAENRLKLELLLSRRVEVSRYSESAAEITGRIVMKPFDPNEVTFAQLRSMGVDERLAMRWMTYREKGGRFKTAGDIKKLYGMKEDEFTRLAAYAFIKASGNIRDKPLNETLPVSGKIELNTADSSTLVSVRGIGPVLASRILRYRDRLGGFIGTGQLREVYGIDSSRFEIIRKFIRVDSTVIRTLSLSGSEFGSLAKHPYIGYDNTRELFRLRRSGTRATPDSMLVNLGIFSTAEFQRVKPYLTE